MPKYLVKAHRPISTPAAVSKNGSSRSIPSIQRINASIQSASMGTSHMTLVAETSKTGVNKVAPAATSDELVNLLASL